MRMKAVGAGALMILLLALVAGCGSSGGSSSSSEPSGSTGSSESSGGESSGGESGGGEESSGEDVSLDVGIIDAETGLVAGAGRPDICGAMVAADAINEGGLVPGVSVDLKAEDDQSTPAVAAQKATGLTSEGVKLFVGGASSAEVLATLPILETAGALSTGGTSKAQEFLSQLKNGVRLNSDDEQDAQAVADYLNNDLKPKTLAIIADQGEFGEGAVENLEPLLKGIDVEATFVDPETTDYKSILSKIASNEPEAVLEVIYGAAQPVALLRQYKESGMSATLVGWPGVLSGYAVKEAGGAADGAFAVDTYATTLENKANEELIANYKKYSPNISQCGKTELERQVAMNYSQMLLLAQAAAKAGSDDPETLRETIIGGTWELPLGEVKFEESGQANAEYKVLEAKGEEVVEKGPVPGSEA
jgi:branched-chain amino acid transport system substrate-binding protein